MNTKTVTVKNGLGETIEIFWTGPGMYAQSGEHRIVKISSKRGDYESSRHFGTAFERRSVEEIVDDFK
jgi:hypothetical protein